LHIGEIRLARGIYEVLIDNLSFQFDSSAYTGFLVGLQPGNYSVEFWDRDQSLWHLCADGAASFIVDVGETFVSSAEFCERPPTESPTPETAQNGLDTVGILGISIAAILLGIGLVVMIVTLVKGGREARQKKQAYLLASGLDRLPESYTGGMDT
jgi:hypothetical protein